MRWYGWLGVAPLALFVLAVIVLAAHRDPMSLVVVFGILVCCGLMFAAVR